MQSAESEEHQADIEIQSGQLQTAASMNAVYPLIDNDLLLEEEEQQASVRKSIIPWIVPILLLLLVASGLLAYYLYESRINADVQGWHEQAKKEAIAGKYSDALALLNRANEARPSYQALDKDLAVVEQALAMQKSLTSVEEQLKVQKLDEAGQVLEEVQASLKDRTEPIFQLLHEQYDEQSIMLTVLKVKEEFDKLTTVEELASKLNITQGLKGDEAAAVREQIISKIAVISYQQAEALLQEKDFNDALSAAEQGLTYAPGDEKLTALKDKIQQDKLDFEQAEQERIENAMQRAAEEDIINQTAALKVGKIEAKLDEYGDLHITGELTNKATRPIYSIFIEYTVYDKDKKKLGSGTAGVTPEYVETGDSAKFTDIVYGAYTEEVTVVVDNATWYLD